MAKILIIEDDEVIAQGMARHLQAAGYDAVGVANGETGLARLRFERPDVCVLDLMLPGVDGWKVIEQARAEGIGTPIVVVSARGTEHDRVHALEIGADDYLVKPFSMKELTARVRVAARHGVRPQEAPRGEAIEVEELRIDPREVQAYVAGESAELTPTEFRLLYALALEDGRVVTRDELLQRLWGRRETHRDRTVDVFVKKLREKLDLPGTRSSRRATGSATSSSPSRASVRTCGGAAGSHACRGSSRPRRTAPAASAPSGSSCACSTAS
jgi:DNA-binding response OmpR family regulator